MTSTDKKCKTGPPHSFCASGGKKPKVRWVDGEGHKGGTAADKLRGIRPYKKVRDDEQDDKSLSEKETWEDEEGRIITSRIKPGMHCEVCKDQPSFPSRFELNRHLQSTIHFPNLRIRSREDRFNICNICGKKYFDRNGLTEHLKSFHLRQRFSCGFCHNLFTTTKSLKGHVIWAHKEEDKQRNGEEGIPRRENNYNTNHTRITVLPTLQKVGKKAKWVDGYGRRSRASKLRAMCLIKNVKEGGDEDEDWDNSWSEEGREPGKKDRPTIGITPIKAKTGMHCEVCDDKPSFSSGLELNRHLQSNIHFPNLIAHSGNEKRNFCYICGKRIPGKTGDLTSHLTSIHLKQVTPCDFCQKPNC